ncbi:MAG: RNA polymerase sigma factor [Woeseiaceae bacterium]
MLTDEQLVEASLNGKASAFDELVDRYQERLLRFLLTRSASYADAEDAIQDTFINAYRYLASFDPRWRFSTWIYRIALRNLAGQKRPEWSESTESLIGPDDPLQNCIDASERDNVWVTARRLLSDEAYAAMWLRYVEDLSVKDISRALEKTQSWTKVTLLRGRRRLSTELAGDPLPAAQRESYG